MSTTSCPRCSGQVTLPVGVSNSTTVRCPLCHAHYTLADALVNMPPLLEVVDVAAEATPDEWFDAASTIAGNAADAVEVPMAEPLDFQRPSEDEPGEFLAVEAESTDDQLEFTAEEADDADLSLQEKDTEVDGLSFSTVDAPSPETPERAEPVAADESILELGEPPQDEAEEIHFDAAAPPDDEIKFDLDASQETADSEAATFAFNEPPPAVAADDEVTFDLDDPHQTTGGNDATIEFNNDEGIRFDSDAEDETVKADQPALQEFEDLRVDASGEAEDIPLDLPDQPVGVPVAAVEPPDEAAGKKGKKKKAKASKAAHNGKPKRSLGSRLVTTGVSTLVAVPIALYLAIWISPAYDFVGLGKVLPRMMLPAGYKAYEGSQIARTAARPPSVTDMLAGAASTSDSDAAANPDGTSGEAPADQPGEEVPADVPPALGPDFTPPTTDNAPPSAESPESDSADTPTPVEPADDPFAPADAPEKMPAKDAAPADDPFAEPASPDAAPTEPAPADDPFAPAADPFAEPESPDAPPSEPAPESPAADTDPIAPPAAEPPTPADADPFAPSPDAGPAANKPLEPTTPAGTEPLPVPDEPAVSAEVLGPRNAAQVTSEQVMSAVQNTIAAGEEMTAAEGANDDAGLRKARANFYVHLFNMADAVTQGQLGPEGADLEPQLQILEPAIRKNLIEDPKRLASIKVFGARWFAFPKRTNNGVVLAGTVESVDHVGKLFLAKIMPGENADTAAVTVVSAKDPQLASGDEVLTLGSIVEQPQDQLSGYEGSEPVVVWSGMTLKIPPASQ